MKKAIIPITRNSNKENSQTGILVVSVTSKKSIPGNEILSNKLTLSRLISNDIRVAAPININMTPKNLEKIFKKNINMVPSVSNSELDEDLMRSPCCDKLTFLTPSCRESDTVSNPSFILSPCFLKSTF